MSNESGFKPFDIGVLVKLEMPEEKVSKGGIILQTETEAPNIYSTQLGVIVELGERAFKGQEDAPKAGDKVFFAKYAGQLLTNLVTKDEQFYRAIDDHDIRLKVEQVND